ncbi:hypothetical protein [Streptomyces glaucus]|uniref:hypothetical protein n=1 Tax=Streptomyces glaucus TaxID=284029 RepID=UPI003CD0C221
MRVAADSARWAVGALDDGVSATLTLRASATVTGSVTTAGGGMAVPGRGDRTVPS